MQLSIQQDYPSLSQALAEDIIQLVKSKPDSLLCLPSGDTPKLPFSVLAQLAQETNTDFSKCHFIGLDEWIGVPPENAGSCFYFFKNYVFDPLGIQPGQSHMFNGLATDLKKECDQMDSYIASKGGIDLMVVGLGMNGHIGFNEPGVDFDQHSHIINLDETTKTVAKKYFTDMPPLNQGITLGLRHLMESSKLVLIANGTKKAPVVKKMLEEPISNQMPASIVRKHSNSTVLLDKESASMLSAYTMQPSIPT